MFSKLFKLLKVMPFLIVMNYLFWLGAIQLQKGHFIEGIGIYALLLSMVFTITYQTIQQVRKNIIAMREMQYQIELKIIELEDKARKL